MICRNWKSLAWMFYGLVVTQSLYTGVKFDCWSGLVACSVGFVIGFLSGLMHGKFKKSAC
jgi:ABC-type dipeptide/oligopeptide/nickel transport system permease subunit